MIIITTDPDRRALATEAKPFVRILSDKMSRALPDTGDTATKAYVAMRRLLAVAEATPGYQGAFELISSEPFALDLLTQLDEFFGEHERVDYPTLVEFQSTLAAGYAATTEAKNESVRTNRRTAARRSPTTVRSRRSIR